MLGDDVSLGWVEGCIPGLSLSRAIERAYGGAHPLRRLFLVVPSHLWRPRDFTIEDKFSSEGPLAACHRQFSLSIGSFLY